MPPVEDIFGFVDPVPMRSSGPQGLSSLTSGLPTVGDIETSEPGGQMGQSIQEALPDFFPTDDPEIDQQEIIDSRQEQTNMLIDILSLPEIVFFGRSIRGAWYSIVNNEGIDGALKRFIKGSPFVHAVDTAMELVGHDPKEKRDDSLAFDLLDSENVTGEDVFKAYGVEEPGILGPLMFEIVTDPSSYFGAFAITKLGDAARRGAMFISLGEKNNFAKIVDSFKKVTLMGQDTPIIIGKTREQLKKLFPTLKAGKDFAQLNFERLSLAQQGELGLRSMLVFNPPFSNVRYDVGKHLPWVRNANVPILNGMEKGLNAMKSKAIGQAIQAGFSQFRQVDVPGGDLDQGRFLSSALKDVATSSAHALTATQAYFDEQTHALLKIWGQLPKAEQTYVSHLLENGIHHIDDALTPELMIAKFDSHMNSLFHTTVTSEAGYPLKIGFKDYIGSNKETMIDVLSAKHPERVNEIATDALESVLAAAGFKSHGIDEVTGKPFSLLQSAAGDVASISQDFTEENVKRYAGAYDIAIRMGEDSPIFEKVLNFEHIGDDILGLLDETDDMIVADMVRDYNGLITELQAKQYGDIVRVAADGEYLLNPAKADVIRKYSSLSAAMQGALWNTIEEGGIKPESLENLRLRAGELIRKRFQIAEALAAHTDEVSVVSDKTRKIFRKEAESYAKLAEQFAVSGNPLTGRNYGNTYASMSRTFQLAADAGTPIDVLKISMYAYENALKRVLREEKAAGVLTNGMSLYLPHIVTKRAAKLINETGRRAGFTPRGRQFTGMSIAEVNSQLSIMGVKATGDIPANSVRHLDHHILKRFEDAYPGFLDELEAVDPDAALMFQTDLHAIVRRRLDKGVQTISRGRFWQELFKPYGEGGLARRSFMNVTEESIPAIRHEMKNITGTHQGVFEILDVSDMYQPNRMRIKDFAGEHAREVASGYPDGATPELIDEFLHGNRHPAGTIIDDTNVSGRFAGGDRDPALLEQVDLMMERQAEIRSLEKTTGLRIVDAHEIKAGRSYAIVHKSAYAEADATWRRLSSPAFMGQLAVFMHKMTNIWKGWNTAPNPNFHARNMVSNWSMMYFGGVRNPRRYTDVMRLRKAIMGIGTESVHEISWTDINGKRMTASHFLQLAKQHGVLDSSAHQMDIINLSRKAADEIAEGTVPAWRYNLNPFSQEFLPVKWGKIVGASIESDARMTVMLDQILKGVDPMAAARHAKKHLMDYDSHMLTHMEKNVMQLAIPFYRFWRRNLPQSMVRFVENQTTYSTIGKMFGNIDRWGKTDELPSELIPDFIEDNYGVKVKIDNEGKLHAFLLKGYMPDADLAEVATILKGLITGTADERLRASRLALARLTPLVKEPAELIGNVSLYTGKQISRFEGDTREYYGFNLPSQHVEFINNVRFLNEVDKLNLANIPRSGERGERAEAGTLARWVAHMTGLKIIQAPIKAEMRRSVYFLEQENRKLKGEYNLLLKNIKDPNRREQMDSLRETMENNKRKILELEQSYHEAVRQQ